jgi:RNase P subunit RPR2
LLFYYMKKNLSMSEAREKIYNFFKSDFSPLELKKIKRLANKYRISLKDYKKLYCKSCLSMLKGKTRVSKTHKIIYCSSCGFIKKFKVSSSSKS